MSEPRPILIDLPGQFDGERIIVRRWRETDADALFAMVELSREHIQRWLSWPDEYHSVDDARAYLRRQLAEWTTRENLAMGIFDREGALLGSVALHPQDWRIPSFEIGYWLGASHEGKGYMAEAVRIATRLAFENLGARRVFIRCDAGNKRSANVAHRCGFVFEGTLRSEHREPDGRLRDTMFFSRIPDDARDSG